MEKHPVHRKVLKNSRGQTLGFIDTDIHGREVGKDIHCKMVGSYDPRRDETFNVKGQLFGHGDMLSSLIVDED